MSGILCQCKKCKSVWYEKFENETIDDDVKYTNLNLRCPDCNSAHIRRIVKLFPYSE